MSGRPPPGYTGTYTTANLPVVPPGYTFATFASRDKETTYEGVHGRVGNGVLHVDGTLPLKPLIGRPSTGAGRYRIDSELYSLQGHNASRSKASEVNLCRASARREAEAGAALDDTPFAASRRLAANNALQHASEGATAREQARDLLVAARSAAVALRFEANKADYHYLGPGGRSEFLRLNRAAHEAEADWRHAAERHTEIERNARLAYVAAGATELRASRAANGALVNRMSKHPMSSLRF